MCYICDDAVPETMPGNPALVGRFATAFSNTASALRDAAVELGNLANENITISLAVDEVRERAGEARGRTNKVAVRYEGAASTYSSYSSALDSAQGAANGARQQIIDNNGDARWWRHRLRDLEGQQFFSSDPEFLADLAEARRQSATYDGYFGTYSGHYAQALIDRDHAVTNAINGLDDAAEAAGLNDGFWDGIAGDFQQLWELASKYLGPILEIIRNVLEILKKIVDILALIVTVLSIFLPMLAPLALALSALSVILSIAIFACSLILFAMGRESLGRVLSDGISMVASVITSKMGGASGSLFSQVRGGTSSLTSAAFTTTRTVAMATDSTLPSLGAAAGDALVEGAKAGVISANAAPISFVLGEGLDFKLSDIGSSAWGEQANPAWDMSGSDGTKMLPGLMDGATFGAASPIAGAVSGWGDFNFHTPAGEINQNFNSVNVVLAS